MRVMCIEETIQVSHTPTPSPIVGSEYNITNRFKYRGIELCELAEFPRKDGFIFAYDVEAFAPLDGPDERERLEDWQTEHLTIEDKLLMALADSMPEVEMSEEATARLWKGIKAHLNAPHE